MLVCVYVCIYVCMLFCMYVCMYVCKYNVCMYIVQCAYVVYSVLIKHMVSRVACECMSQCHALLLESMIDVFHMGFDADLSRPRALFMLPTCSIHSRPSPLDLGCSRPRGRPSCKPPSSLVWTAAAKGEIGPSALEGICDDACARSECLRKNMYSEWMCVQRSFRGRNM